MGFWRVRVRRRSLIPPPQASSSRLALRPAVPTPVACEPPRFVSGTRCRSPSISRRPTALPNLGLAGYAFTWFMFSTSRHSPYNWGRFERGSSSAQARLFPALLLLVFFFCFGVSFTVYWVIYFAPSKFCLLPTLSLLLSWYTATCSRSPSCRVRSVMTNAALASIVALSLNPSPYTYTSALYA